MECHSDLIFFLLERAKSLVQKYIKEFDWRSFLKVTIILEQKTLKNSSATLVTFFVSKNICFSFFIVHFRRFRAPYICSCSLQRRLSFGIKITGIAYKSMNRRQFYKKNKIVEIGFSKVKTNFCLYILQQRCILLQIISFDRGLNKLSFSYKIYCFSQLLSRIRVYFVNCYQQ